MYEIRAQDDLMAFYRFTNEHSDVWELMKDQRLKHRKLGNGTLGEFDLKVGSRSDPTINVHFVTPTQSSTGTKPKELAVGTVFGRGLIESLVLPPILVERFETFKVRENWKEDWREFEKILKRHRVESLYHFTDSRNLNSIKKKRGLYSWWRCEQEGIGVSAPGGSDLSREIDKEKGLQNYVRLGFNRNPPMLYVARKRGRIERYKTLKIDPSVIYHRSTCFSDINATDKEAQIGNDLESFKRIRLAIATRRWEDDTEKRYFQAEVLVEGHVPLDQIINL